MLSKHSRRVIERALREDIGSGDRTTELTVPASSRCTAKLVAKQSGVLSGVDAFQYALEAACAHLENWTSSEDGTEFEAGDVLASFAGATRGVLTGERTALNFVQHLSGVATLTRKYVDAVEGLRTVICDTRKTTPLLRELEKAAVVHGGGTNHRFNLSDGILIKDNHIAVAGGIGAAVRRAVVGVHHLMGVEVEVTSLEELQEALDEGANVILLDNMRIDQLKAAVSDVQGRNVKLEASGNVHLDNVRAVAETGVDIISVGALTHSAPAVDLSLSVEHE